jgi:phosphopantetheinyl transferase
MPLLIHQQIDTAAKLGVWRIEEPELFFREETGLVSAISHPRKRLQHLAGRFLLKKLEPTFPLHAIRIGPSGKPLTEDSLFHFSLSHCGYYVAAILSPHGQMGIDIEQVQNRILTLRQKFLTQEEEALLAQHFPAEANAFTFGWSVKEAVYKWNGEGLVDFRQHIRIEAVACQNNVWNVSCRFLKTGNELLQVAGFMLDGHFLSYILTR